VKPRDLVLTAYHSCFGVVALVRWGGRGLRGLRWVRPINAQAVAQLVILREPQSNSRGCMARTIFCDRCGRLMRAYSRSGLPRDFMTTNNEAMLHREARLL
jgi:hypothetical protein